MSILGKGAGVRPDIRTFFCKRLFATEYKEGSKYSYFQKLLGALTSSQAMFKEASCSGLFST
jgi:hypothetical protein